MMRALTALLFGLILLASGCGGGGEKADSWPLVKDCDLHRQVCTARQGDAAVTLEIRPRPIRVARPLDVSVHLENITATAVALDISGLNMYMGYNRVSLHPAGQGRWTGQTMLAFCTSQTMQWQLSVLITRPDGSQLVVPFYLETRRSGP